MSEEKQLPAAYQSTPPAVIQPKKFSVATVQDAMQLGDLFVKAGLFEVSDAEAKKGVTEEKKAALAATKLVFGASYGLSPAASLAGLHVVKGKIELDYKALGALIKRTPGYDYKVLVSTEQVAKIEFFKFGVSVGIQEWNTADMQKANLGGDMHSKYPRVMKFARCMHEGVAKYMPEISMGFGLSDGQGEASEEEIVREIAQKELESEAIESGNVIVEAVTVDEETGEVTETVVSPVAPTTSERLAKEAEIHNERGNKELAESCDKAAKANMSDRGAYIATGTKNGWTNPQLMEFIKSKDWKFTEMLKSQADQATEYVKAHTYNDFRAGK